MIKTIHYLGSEVDTYEINSTPCVNMKMLLESIIPDSWSDYVQVLNSSEDMINDLSILKVNSTWVIPVYSVNSWLFSFSLRNMRGPLYDAFRLFRRNFEKLCCVAWAADVIDLAWKGHEYEYDPVKDPISISNIFHSYGISELSMEGYSEDHHQMNSIQYLGYVASSTECGPRGALLSDQIDYIENLPNAEYIFSALEEVLERVIWAIDTESYSFDAFLDKLNSVISSETTKFFGEAYAK